MPPSVAFEEMAGSPQERWTEEGFVATVELMCAWNVRNTLATEIMAERAAYPRIPLTKAYPRSATVQSFPAKTEQASSGWGSGTLTDYEKALVTIEYDTEGPNEDLVTESLEPTAEFMTLDHEEFRWTSGTGDPLKEGEAPGKLVRGFDYKLTFHQAINVPAAILTLPGYVNNAPISAYTLGLSFAAETLLFQPPTATRRITALTVEAWEINYRFTFRPNGWNKFWRNKTDSWESIYHNGGGEYKNYPLGDFSALFPS